VSARELLVPDYAPELADAIKRGMRGVFVRERSRDTYSRAGLIKLVATPRARSHREAEGFYHDRAAIEKLRQAAAKKGRVVRVVDQKTAVLPLHDDTLADPNKLLASVRSLLMLG
jgi:hypothetical protein